MEVIDINGDYDSMVVTFEDGREVEIGGELLYRKFVAYENSILEWKKPAGKPISESEKQEIIDAVMEAEKNAVLKITFETYRELTPEEKKVEFTFNGEDYCITPEMIGLEDGPWGHGFLEFINAEIGEDLKEIGATDLAYFGMID